MELSYCTFSVNKVKCTIAYFIDKWHLNNHDLVIIKKNLNL